MSDKNWDPSEILDRAIQEVANDPPDEEWIRQASGTVWSRIESNFSQAGARGIRNCGDFQALFAPYQKGSLSESRRLLLEDHLRVCLSCRRDLTGIHVPQSKPRMQKVTSPWKLPAKIAAGVLLILALSFVVLMTRMPPAVQAAILERAEGSVFRISDETAAVINAGEAVDAGHPVRTASGARALMVLPDGTRLEMDQRTELLWNHSAGVQIQLKRGSAIIHAVKRSEPLRVSTADLEVEVTGTVFAINHGVRGSRISVLEGSVLVQHGHGTRTLDGGQQFSSHPRSRRVPLAQEVAWSRHSQLQRAWLQELSVLGRDIEQATFGNSLRWQSRMPALLPEDVLVYAAVPNVSGRLLEVYRSFKERISQTEVLQDVFQDPDSAEEDVLIETVINRISRLGASLGEELVLTAARREHEKPDPLLMAEVRDAARLEQSIRDELQAQASDDDLKIRFLTDPSKLNPVRQESTLYLVLDDDLLLMSPSPGFILEVSQRAGRKAALPVQESPFLARVEDRYQSGVDWLLSLDVEGMATAELNPPRGGDLLQEKGGEPTLRKLGIGRVQHLMVERKQEQGVVDNRALVTFDEAAGGLVSWLDQPGPIGGLDFISHDAHLVAAFVIRDPLTLLDEILARLESVSPQTWERLVQFQLSKGINLREDVAAPLGGEVVLAIDGPVLPEPSWKLVWEIYDPAKLQATLEWLVEELNAHALENGEAPLELVTMGSDQARLHLLRAPDRDLVWYRYVEGYLIATPNEALLHQSVQYRAVGYTIASSAQFNSVLPRDASLNMSGLFYHNLTPLLDSFLATPVGQSLRLPETSGDSSFLNLLKQAPPAMIAFYRNPGEMMLASTSDLRTLWLNLALFASLSETGKEFEEGESESSN